MPSSPSTIDASAARGNSRSKTTAAAAATDANDGGDFAYPFNELMLWAVLTRRHEMAKCVWAHGEEAMAKALAVIRLYKCMSREAADDYTEVGAHKQPLWGGV